MSHYSTVELNWWLIYIYVYIYIYIYIYRERARERKAVMGELSKLHKNENNTDISLSQIYLWKFNENILKYYTLDLFKEIGFNHGP